MFHCKDYPVENETYRNKKIKTSHNGWKEEQDNVVECPPWSDLHTDLLDQIVGNLCFVDQVYFHAVCKSWSVAQYKTRPADLLPWVVRVWRPSLDMFQCQLYAMPLSFNPKPISVENIYLDEFVSSYPLCFDRDIDITCNYGWILFQIPTRDYTGTTFLFYSPLTKGVVVLPQLTHSRGAKCELTTGFSSEPDSPDFVFLVVKRSDTINTYRHGEGEWNTKELDDLYCPGPDTIVVFTRKLFVFVDADGCMASYNITSGTWKLECILRNQVICRSCRRYAFEINGELMLIHHCVHLLYSVTKFDWNNKCWVPLNNLGDRTLFASTNCFCIKAIEEEEEANSLVSANKIHVLRDSCCHVYYLKGSSALPNIFMNNPHSIKIWGSETQLQNGLTFWLERPGNIVTEKQERAKRVSVYEGMVPFEDPFKDNNFGL
ncbi:hypothetical protein POM88_040585 [Heracleum sosnowskyi]|uniref:KIB1-4 beta-propeller domain-containing protein n=1 Tax=Heracleum sosnowskyi TaxID=360622 RepID=A0AAD8HET0_9APIA|nr:hypothetical protein POM88_040585 [Heracleum sosnowskyi]